MIKRGAPDLKGKLHNAAAAGQAMVVLWTSTAAEAACTVVVRALQSIASTSRGASHSASPSTMASKIAAAACSHHDLSRCIMSQFL